MNKFEAVNNLENRKSEWGDSLEGHYHSGDLLCPDCRTNYELLMRDLVNLRNHIIGYTNSPPNQNLDILAFCFYARQIVIPFGSMSKRI